MEELFDQDEIVTDEDGRALLSAGEMLQLELNLEKQRVQTLKREILNSENEKRTLENKIYKAQMEALELRIQLLNRPDPLLQGRFDLNANQMEYLKEESAAYVDALKEKYGIRGKGFGYDPESGQIVMNEEEDVE